MFSLKEFLFGWLLKGNYELSILDSIICFIEIFLLLFIILYIKETIKEYKERKNKK